MPEAIKAHGQVAEDIPDAGLLVVTSADHLHRAWIHAQRTAAPGKDAERSHIELLDKLTAVDLLHIDDVGAERTNEWVLEELYSIVNARYEDQRSIVITTNILDREALCEQITDRTVSRLTEMCDELPILGPDRRMG